jgi:hypothetical protein
LKSFAIVFQNINSHDVLHFLLYLIAVAPQALQDVNMRLLLEIAESNRLIIEFLRASAMRDARTSNRSIGALSGATSGSFPVDFVGSVVAIDANISALTHYTQSSPHNVSSFPDRNRSIQGVSNVDEADYVLDAEERYIDTPRPELSNGIVDNMDLSHNNSVPSQLTILEANSNVASATNHIMENVSPPSTSQRDNVIVLNTDSVDHPEESHDHIAGTVSVNSAPAWNLDQVMQYILISLLLNSVLSVVMLAILLSNILF